MDRQTNNVQSTNPDKPLLSSFLHELNIARRQLALYPAEHPQIKSSIDKTLNLLTELFHSHDPITLGITPDALLFEQQWLAKEDANHRDFAGYFSDLGIASVSFHAGLKGPELIRFNQLLRYDREKIESFGGVEQLLEQQQIENISVISVDYDAFQSSQKLVEQQSQIWENFLHGLQNGILDFGESTSDLDLTAVAEVLNQQLASNRGQEQYAPALDRFIENRIQQQGFAQANTETDRKFNALLGHLNPAAQEQLFNSIFRVLDQHQEAAPSLLKKIPAHILQNAIAKKSQQKLNVSSRLFLLASNLANDSSTSFSHNIHTGKEQLSQDMVRARLDVLFSEEQQDLYMPGNYQTALGYILGDDLHGSIPDDEKEKLKSQIEAQSVELNYVAILFEMLHEPLDVEQETAVQDNLLDLSRYFLDTGDFSSLRDIYQQWSHYLYSGNAAANIFDEKVLANHTQPTFMAEVIDGFELWEEELHHQIVAYIAAVGEPYSDLLIEQLGLAPEWSERQRWINILESIGGDAQQKILRALTDERWYLVRNLLAVLGKKLDPHNIKKVQKLSEHPHPKVRIEVIRILFSCNPATANRLLLQELRSEDIEARFSAIKLADLSRDPKVLALLHKGLELEPTDDSQLELS
ncbi:MAG: HEAT repeat domain-containing protein, partial [Deltaproteobacteria bacterium]|nr:HEAT repeat domain-containing protein [Deltaproteobacteria bacterium]